MNPAQLLERTQWDFFWVPQIPGAGIVDRPEIAYIHCDRPIVYANTVVRTRAPAERLPALLDEVAAAHAAHGSRWLTADTFDHRPLEAALAARGYEPAFRHDAVALAVEAFTPRRSPGITARVVDDMASLRDAYTVLAAAFGGTAPTDPEIYDRALVGCTAPAARTRRVVAYDAHGAPLATGAFNVYPELGIAFLWGGGTVPEGRGRGAYSAVLATRIEQLRRAGVKWAGLYARRETSAPIVKKQGFEVHGWMTYWDRPAADPVPPG